MKKLLGILAVVVALCFCMTVVSFAKTADIVNQSVEGTAVIDGVKDDAYAAATTLEFVQKGKNNGGGGVLDAPIATAQIINDAEYVYVYVDVIDPSLDNTSANNYEQDSVEAFWMVNNAKTQIRYHYDGVIDADSGDAPVEDEDYKAVTTATGYAVELRLPITDVRANQIEMCLQINYCSDGAREYTCYIPDNADADDAYQRSSRESDYDVWWTLTLAGDHADTRVDKADEPMELTKDTYTRLQNCTFGAQLFSQDVVSWGWVGMGSEVGGVFNGTIECNWADTKMAANWGADQTNNFTSQPKFAIQINDNGFLKLPEGAVQGDTGDTGRFTFTYTDVTITADGYDDVVVPGGEFVNKRFTIKEEGGWTSGTAVEVDLAGPAREQLGLDVEQFCDYLKNVTSVSTTVTFTEFDGRTQADLDEFLAAFAVEDEAKIAELQEYIDRVDAAQAIVDDANAELTAKQDAIDDARKAANRATKQAEGYPMATEKAAELVAAVEEMTKTVEAEAAPAEPEVADETAPEAPAEENKPASKPAETKKDGGNTGLIVGIIIAVVVVAIIAVVAILGKKKKA